MSINDSESNRKDSRREKINKNKQGHPKQYHDDDDYFNKKAKKHTKKEIKQRLESMIEDEKWEDWEDYHK